MTPFAIDSFVSDCLEARRTDERHGSIAVKDVLASALDQPAAIEAAVGHPSSIPVFSTWHNSDELTVLHVVWPPTVQLLAHDHKMWATIGLYGGREDNHYFRPGGDVGLEASGGTTLRTGDTVVLGSDVIHSVSNPSREWTAAIHVYGGDYFGTPRNMWPDPGADPVAFDVDVVTATLDEAAARNR
jgi:predicted metal-dependent enzyme (double-stranded beta helix superfamily)